MARSWKELSIYERMLLTALAKSYAKIRYVNEIPKKGNYSNRVIAKLFPKKLSNNAYEHLREGSRDLESRGFIHIIKNTFYPEDVEIRLSKRGAVFLLNVSPEEEVYVRDLEKKKQVHQELSKITRRDSEDSILDIDMDLWRKRRNRIPEEESEDDETLGADDDWTMDWYDGGGDSDHDEHSEHDGDWDGEDHDADEY